MQTARDKREPGVFSFDANSLKAKLASCISRHVSSETLIWLEEKASVIRTNENIQGFRVAFTATTRKTGKEPIDLSQAEITEIQQIRPSLEVQYWAIDRLCRVWLLMQLDATDQNKYFHTIESMFPTAELSEQVALYSSLPVLAYPEKWRGRCAEGIRSNISAVLESIMCNNPYPSENLDEKAWNQLVLKAFFTEKKIHQIVNLDARANQNLANTLSDYAHERWAAHRSVHPLLWRCVGKFINEKIFPDVLRISLSANSIEREAAALACAQSTYPQALELFKKNQEFRSILTSGVTWEDLEKKLDKNS